MLREEFKNLSIEEKLDLTFDYLLGIKEDITSIICSNTEVLNNRFLDSKEAAEYLGMSINTLYKYTCKKLIAYHKPGRQLYFTISDLDDFILNNEHRYKCNMEIEKEAEKHAYRLRNIKKGDSNMLSDL